jgi:uroporphyrinogen-III synthase
MLDERSPDGQVLYGQRVLITRPRHQVAALSDRLRELGAIPVEFPVIEIVPATDDELADLVDSISEYDWIVFTSVNTVAVLEDILKNVSSMPSIAAIGHATASAIASLGYQVDLVPGEYVAEAVLEELIGRGVAGKRVLLPRADIARDTLPDGLREAGALVDVVPVYRTRLPERVDSAILEMVTNGRVDVVTFTSPSTVRNLLQLLGGRFPEGIVVACIGPITARAVEDAGINVDILASEYSIPGLVRALSEREQS